VLLKIPTHTLAQGLQLLCFSHWRIFTIKHDVGIARTLKTQEITFMYMKQPFEKRQQKEIYVIIYNKNKPLNMPFATKQNKKLKPKGVWKHYDT